MLDEQHPGGGRGGGGARAHRKFFPNQGGNIGLKMSLVKNVILKGAVTRTFAKCEMLMK